MFAKFKNWLKHHQEAGQLIFEQQTKLINGRQFTIRRARFTDISSIIRIEELIYGTAPWNAGAGSRSTVSCNGLRWAGSWLCWLFI